MIFDKIPGDKFLIEQWMEQLCDETRPMDHKSPVGQYQQGRQSVRSNKYLPIKRGY